MFPALCILARIVANPLSNVFQKLLTRWDVEPLLIICVTHGLLTLVCGPALFFYPPPPSSECWLNISICAVLAIAGDALIVQAAIYYPAVRVESIGLGRNVRVIW